MKRPSLVSRASAVSVVLVLAALSAPPARLAVAQEGPRTIAITAKRFEFAPASVTIARGETVKLRVTSEDVKHGFFQRDLKIDADLTPGEPNEISVTAQKAGTYTVICDHFCGAQHGNMKMTIVVE